MPRTYSYDYFQNPKKEVNYIPKHEKKQYTDSQPSLPDESKFHYGKRHAETEEILSAKKMNRQLEELAGLPKKQKKAKKAKRADTIAPATKMAQPELPAPDLHRGAPIGALPMTEAPELTPAGFGDLLESAMGHVRMVRLAARDLTLASWRLAKLPLDAAALAARRFVPRHA